MQHECVSTTNPSLNSTAFKEINAGAIIGFCMKTREAKTNLVATAMTAARKDAEFMKNAMEEDRKIDNKANEQTDGQRATGRCIDNERKKCGDDGGTAAAAEAAATARERRQDPTSLSSWPPPTSLRLEAVLAIQSVAQHRWALGPKFAPCLLANLCLKSYQNLQGTVMYSSSLSNQLHIHSQYRHNYSSSLQFKQTFRRQDRH